MSDPTETKGEPDVKRTRSMLVGLLAVAMAVSVVIGACASPAKPTKLKKTAPAPGHMGAVAIPKVTGIAPPSVTNQSSPVAAVMSYLAWTSYAYRIGNSDVATLTFTPEEEVRVNSYVQLNAQKSRLIEQHLSAFKPGRVSIEGTRAVLPAREDWTYSYLSTKDSRSISPTYTASYDTTYTLVRSGPARWVVDMVNATALGEVK